MKSRTQQQGSALHIVIIIVLVVALIGTLGFVFWNNFIKQTNTTQDTTTEVSQLDTLYAIREDILALPHRTNPPSGSNREMDVPLGGDINGEVSISKDDVDVSIVFNASIYADNPDIAPVGSTGAEGEGNGSGTEEAIDKDKVDAVLTSHGLSKTETYRDSSVTKDLYVSDSVGCVVLDSQGLATVTCVLRSHLDTVVAATEDSFKALKKEFPDVQLNKYTTFVYSENSQAAGIVFAVASGLNDEIDAYMVKTPSKDWRYVASSTPGIQSIDYPACSLVATEEFGNIFGIKDCE
ncbi:MAG: hypothetical protein WAQ27_01120 [Candidatus Microsaccharimonas sp.]